MEERCVDALLLEEWRECESGDERTDNQVDSDELSRKHRQHDDKQEEGDEDVFVECRKAYDLSSNIPDAECRQRHEYEDCQQEDWEEPVSEDRGVDGFQD